MLIQSIDRFVSIQCSQQSPGAITGNSLAWFDIDRLQIITIVPDFHF